ncbi:MAG: SH3 domain-containing protein [Bacteroidota bacterium]
MAPSGLRMRNAPQTGGTVTTIPYGAKVTIQLVPSPEAYEQYGQNVDGLFGIWPKVSYDGQTGYVFDGFLSRFPAPSLQNTDPYQYLLKHFTMMSRPVERKKFFPEELPQWVIDTLQIFQSGECVIVYESLHGEWAGVSSVLDIRGMTMQEAYLLTRILYRKKIQTTLKRIERAMQGADDALCYTGMNQAQLETLKQNYIRYPEKGRNVFYDFYLCECYEAVTIQEVAHTIQIRYGVGCH